MRSSMSLSRGTIRLIAIISFLAIAFLGSEVAFADSATIFDVRKNLPLEPDEEVYHDFYINAGHESGIKKGTFITVIRAVPVHDPVQSKQQGTLNVVIGRLQIIHVEHNVSVGRQYSETSDEDRPTLEFEAIMIGDHVDLDSMTAEAPGQKHKARAPKANSAKADVQTESSPVTPPTVNPTTSLPSKNDPGKEQQQLPVPAGATTNVVPEPDHSGTLRMAQSNSHTEDE